MTHLSRELILEASDLTQAQVDVPEWGGFVKLRMMTGLERSVFEQSMVTVKVDGTREQDLTHVRVNLVALTAIDEAGNLLFSKDDVARLGTKSSKALNRVFEASTELNALGDTAVKNAVKN
jgi:hypothetical protein